MSLRPEDAAALAGLLLALTSGASSLLQRDPSGRPGPAPHTPGSLGRLRAGPGPRRHVGAQGPGPRRRTAVRASWLRRPGRDPSNGAARGGHPRGARWADAGTLGPLLCRGPSPGRLAVGALERPGRLRPGLRTGLLRGRAVVAVERAQSLAVFGPTQSGKTTALAVPAILDWEGPVLAASVKTDLVRSTVDWRRSTGPVWCFDPACSTGLPSDRWSPVDAARTWAGARRAAADLTEVAHGPGTTADGEFWYAAAAKLLAPLLLAAATGGCGMADVVRWVDTQEVGEVLALLQTAGVPQALDAAQATWQREERQRSSVYTTAETVLEPFAEPGPGVRPGRTIDPHELLAAGGTLYVCAPAHDQRRLRAAFTALVKAVLEAAFTRAARRTGPPGPPLLVVLDEAANIAPVPELDGLAATCAGHGVQLVTVWQDLAQVRARYGERAATVVNNHRAKLFLPGIADPGTLDQASHLVGDEEVLADSVTRDRVGGRSTTAAPIQRRLLPPDALRQLAPGTGVLVYGTLPPARVRLRPWWEEPRLRARGHANP